MDKKILFDYNKYRFTQKWFHEQFALKTELHKYTDTSKKIKYIRNWKF